MKTQQRNVPWRIERAGQALAPALLLFVLTNTSPLIAGAVHNRSLPPEKGAAGLLTKALPALLPSETNHPTLAPLAATWRSLAPDHVQASTVRSNQTATLAVHRIRQAPGRPILVFLHGCLADHLTWEYVAAGLHSEYEIWLVDLPGCGRSEPLKVSSSEPDAYSGTALADRVLQSLRHCLHDTGAGQSITIVGHSLGAMITIRMLSCPDLQTRYQAELARVDRAVLLAPCDLAVTCVPAKFLPILGLKSWMLVVGDILGATDSKIREITRANYHREGCATLEQQKRFSHQLKDRQHLEATRQMLLGAAPFDLKTMRPRCEELDRLVADYSRITVPMLIVFGTWDETLLPAMGNKLKDEIPGSWLVKIPRRGHSLPTEEPEECARLIRWWQQGGGPDEVLKGNRGLLLYSPAGKIAHPEIGQTP